MELKKGRKYSYSLIGDSLTPADLVGQQALMLNKAAKAGASIAPGFVISGNAFDDFLVANDLVDGIIEQINNMSSEDDSTIDKGSQIIKSKIQSGVMPGIVLEEIIKSYGALTNFSDEYVMLSPSVLNGDLDASKFRQNLAEPVVAQGQDQIIKAVLDLWADLFSADAIKNRLDREYEGSLTQPILVQRFSNVEISGVAYNFDMSNQVPSFMTVTANLGISSRENLPPHHSAEATTNFLQNLQSDFYLVDKGSGMLVNQLLNAQKFMQVKSNDTAGRPLIRVKISKLWSERQKLDEIQLRKLLLLLERLSDIGSKWEAEWVFESGEFSLIRITELDLASIHSLPHFNWPNGGGSATRPGAEGSVRFKLNFEPKLPGQKGDVASKDEDASTEQKKGVKSFDLSKSRTKPVPSADMLTNLVSAGESAAKSAPADKSLPEVVIPEVDATEREDKAEAVKKMLPEIKAVTELWWDRYVPTSELKVFVNNIDALGIITVPAVVMQIGEDVSKLKTSQKLQKQVCEFLAHYLVALTPKPLILGIDLAADIDVQVQIFTQLRNLYGHRNFWVVLPELERPQQIAEYKKMLTVNGFRRTGNFKVFQLISQPLYLLGLDKLLEQGIDGVVLDLDALLLHGTGQRVAASSALDGENKEIFLNSILAALTKKSKLKLFTVIKTNSEQLLDECLLPLLEIGVNGLVYPWPDVYEFKQNLAEKETHILTKSLKKIKNKLNKL